MVSWRIVYGKVGNHYMFELIQHREHMRTRVSVYSLMSGYDNHEQNISSSGIISFVVYLCPNRQELSGNLVYLNLKYHHLI